jgi:Ca2+-binding RTX toxin-like protein
MLSDILSSAPNKLRTDNADIYTSVANERVLGGQGNDEITMGPAEAAFGEQGNDKIIGGSQAHYISGGLGNDDIEGGANGFSFLFGDAGNDKIRGGADFDVIDGGVGNDILEGNGGLDNLCGGARDRMTGGANSDQFEFNAISESRPGAARDLILDFTSDELIDLFTIDARRGVGGNQAFKFIGKQAFDETKGELHYFKQGNHLIVEGDVNGDGRADFQIQVHGVLSLTADNFAL